MTIARPLDNDVWLKPSFNTLRRFNEIGVDDIFGVAGDYAFPVNDAIVEHESDRAVARLKTTYEAAAELGGWDRSLNTTQNRLAPLSMRRS